jgi:large subunit ribosomal protein L9
MEVILLEDLANKGSMGSLIKVAPGFARNYLIPNKLAIVASTHNKRQLEHEKRLVSFKRAKAKAQAEAGAKALAGLILTIRRKAGDQDKLFGSVTATDIQEGLKLRGIDVDRRKLDLPESIRKLGTYDVEVRLNHDIRTTIQVSVVPEPT